MCINPRAISRLHAAREVLDQRVSTLPEAEPREQLLDPLGPRPARHVIQHAVQLEVLVRGEIHVKARVLEDDAEPRAHVVGRVTGSKPSTRNVPMVGSSIVISMWMVVDLPAPFGPRKAKTSPG